MRIRPLLAVTIVLSVLALSWVLQDRNTSTHSPATAAGEQGESQALSAGQPVPPGAPVPAPALAAADSKAIESDSPVDATARARFNEQARDFFARAQNLAEAQRLSEAQHLEQELARLERAGGMSAGETFLLRTGLIRQTVADQAEQAAQIKALKERYESEDRRRTAEANLRSDPAFESYKVRESEIVAEVAAMQTIPDGLTRDEYLRRRLQAARERITP